MSKPLRASVFQSKSQVPDLLGLSYYMPELRQAPEAPAPQPDAHRAALEQMFGYYG